ncbi:MAG: type II secretion system protein [Burkholderiales bacterium]|nr:type II secretion system protein [Burkholderiales bacterium]
MLRARGFTLIEMAVVIAVVALLLGSILIPLATQVEERRFGEARRILDDAREALIGFAIANGRLPCPASPDPNAVGVEFPSGGGECNNPYDGLLPAATLGLYPADAAGFAVDPWGNRIRYAVTTAHTSAFTTFTTANSIGTQFLAGALSPDLQVCSTATGVSGTPPTCASGKTVTANAPAVVFSVGPNGVSGATGPDEVENANRDRLFVSRPPGSVGSAEGEFDDIVVWLSPHILYNRLVAAGKLP